MRTYRFSQVLSVTALGFVCAAFATSAGAAEPWVVRPEWVSAHESFLASDALQGRGSATRDEAIAAAYVGAQFEGYGLKTAPGMSGYLQTATIIKPRLNGSASLTIGNATVADSGGLTLLASSGKGISGPLQVLTSDDVKALPAADVLLVTPTDKVTAVQWMRAASARGVKLLILRENEDTRRRYEVGGKRTTLNAYLEDQPPAKPRLSIATLTPDVFDTVARTPGVAVTLNLPEVVIDKSTTTNAIGYLQGSDANAGTLLFTAHLDHLGVQPDGTIMHGANDDASGTTAVLELAHALAAGKQPRRSILFVAYGSEEIGEYGSNYFASHSPVPLKDIIANLEFEMIGAQDPKLPADSLMMTGFERSDFGEALKAHGALVTGDPYPDQHFFERSDNYQLALTGIVAHTVSGWAVTPTYHSPTDDLAHLNLAFMTTAIQSLIAPVRWLADSDFTPQWKPGGKPAR